MARKGGRYGGYNPPAIQMPEWICPNCGEGVSSWTPEVLKLERENHRCKKERE